MNKLIVPVKQGEEFNLGFTIKAGDNPMDISNYNVIVQVKEVPLEDYKPKFSKTITTDSDINDVGIITYPTLGQFVIHLSKEDTSIYTGDYYLIIALSGDNYYDIISSRACGEAIFRVCEQ